MKTRERFDKILLSCRDRIQEEVSALIGKPFKLGEPSFKQVSKEELFAELSGRQVLAHVQIEGSVQGNGCLLIGVKDAIYIGGTLIMLPESELDSVMAEQQYSEELQDSYGEVANIICGASTITFEEQYPKNLRFVRTEQELVTPVKVTVASDQPIADLPYYRTSIPMQLAGRDLGALTLVFPAEPFELIESAVLEGAKQSPQPDQASDRSSVVEEPAGEDSVGIIERSADGNRQPEEVRELERSTAEGASVADPAETAIKGPSKRDLSKQRKLVDDLLRSGMAKVSEEVSALLGGTLKVIPEENMPLTKEQFLDQAGGRQIMTRLDIRGEGQGEEAYLFVDVKTAIYLGGALIMLPEAELEETARAEDFGDDARDAYGEVTNIIAGVYTATFEEQYRVKLGFVKAAMEAIVPAKIAADSDDVFPDQGYYLSHGQVQYNDRALGRLQFLLPARVVELEDLLLADDQVEVLEEKGGVEQPTGRPGGPQQSVPQQPTRLAAKIPDTADIVLVTDDDGEANRIAAVLSEMGYMCRILCFKDPINSVLTPRVQMVFLVMQEASEQAFGAAIKISSAGLPIPMVAAGPAWTRSLVLKAVKYGACDILITPASVDDIREKIAVNLVKKAA
jgi:chemotaxis protein CheY-P-specific phosphatase CheC